MSKSKPSSKKKKEVLPAAPPPQEAGTTAQVSVEDKPAKDRTILYQKVALFVLAFLVFANSIPNSYNLDDELYTSGAQKVAKHGIKAIPQIFTRHTFSDNENSFEYRPITMLSFALQFLYISPTAVASHTINLLLYAITCVLLFTLLLKWFKKAHAWYAFAVCLLFVVHPLHTEVVASAKSRDEILAFLFVVLSFLVAWRYHETGKIAYLFLYPVVFIIGILCKKTVLPLIIIPSVAFYFFTDMSIKKIALGIIPAMLLLRLMSFATTSLAAEEQRLFFAMENPFYTSNYGIATKTATGIYISGWYLYLHIIPFPLVFYYGYRYVPIVGWDNIRVWASLLVYLSFLVYIIWNLRKRTIPAFAAIWFVLNIFVFSNIFRPAPGMMAERFMYSASFGFCMLFVWVLFRLLKVDPAQFKFNAAGKRLAIILVVICLCYGARSVERNMDWKNKVTLYRHDVKYLGESTKGNMLNGELMMGVSNLYKQKAMAYRDGKDMVNAKLYYDSSVYFLNVAKENFKQAIRITPSMGSAINNLAVIYFNLDSTEQAKIYINMALRGNDKVKASDVAINANDRAKLNHNLGVLYYKDRKVDSALYQFGLAIYYDSTFGEAYIDMSEVLLMSKDTANAIKVLLKAARNMPDQGLAYTDLANIALYQRDTSMAVVYCSRAAEMRKINPQVLVFLRNYYQSKNNAERVQYYTRKMQELMDDNKQRLPQETP